MARSFQGITVGVVGTGFMGVAHPEALRRFGLNINGIVGSTPERAREKAVKAKLPHVLDSYEALAVSVAEGSGSCRSSQGRRSEVSHLGIRREGDAT